MSTNKACIARLQKEYKALLKEPVPHITAHPSPSSLLEWHYVLEGNADSPYKGGFYHGKIVFPPQYPFKPPSLSLYTPTGRFATNTKLCLSMSDFHPETWNPMWSVGTILNGLLSFLHDEQPTTGSILSTPAEKQQLAAQSLAFNAKNPTFRKLFGEWIAELKQGGAAAGSFEGAQGSPEEKEGKGAGQGETTSGSAEGQQGLGAAGAPEGAGQGQPGEGGTKPGVVRSQGKAAGGGGPGGNGSTIMWVIVAGLVVVVGLALVPYFAPGQAGADSAS